MLEQLTDLARGPLLKLSLLVMAAGLLRVVILQLWAKMRQGLTGQGMAGQRLTRQGLTGRTVMLPASGHELQRQICSPKRS